MEVEDIPREGLPSRGAAKEKGNLSIGHCVFPEIVVYGKGMPARVPEVFPHSAAGVRSDILHGGRVTGIGSDNGGIFHGIIFF